MFFDFMKYIVSKLKTSDYDYNSNHKPPNPPPLPPPPPPKPPPLPPGDPPWGLGPPPRNIGTNKELLPHTSFTVILSLKTSNLQEVSVLLGAPGVQGYTLAIMHT